MNSQQLQEARHALWHQNATPLTTLEDAQKWLETNGICLWLPRGGQFAAPMPSFVEACAGAAAATPAREAIVHAGELLSRLVESGVAVPLNLLGTNIGVEGERADFIVASSALSYVYALRGAKPWKGAPPTGGAGRVSTLSLRVWEGLQAQDTMELSELREMVGHDVSDAGVLRALGELWSSLRAIPIPQMEGKPARWQLLSRRFSKQMNAGSSMGQAAALSALISLYLDSVVAASTEEIEAALSPLVARSRVGEVVRALEANRQIEFTAVGGTLMMHFSGVEAHLPPAIEIVLPPSTAERVSAVGAGPKKYAAQASRPPRPGRPERLGPGAAREAGPRRIFAAGEGRPASGEARRPAFSRGAAERPARKPFGDRSQFKPGGRGEFKPAGPGEFKPGERRQFKPRAGGAGGEKPFGAATRERGPFRPRAAGGDGERRRPPTRTGPPREGRAPFKPRSEAGGPRRVFDAGARKPFARSGGEARERTFGGAGRGPAKRFGAGRPPAEPGERKPIRRDGQAGSGGEGGKPFGLRKPYGGKPGGFGGRPGSRPGGRPESKFGAGRPPREGQAGRSERSVRSTRPSSGEAAERRPWQNRPTGGPGAGRPAGDRPPRKAFGGKKPSFGKPSGARPSGKPFADRPRSGEKRGAAGGESGPGTGFKKRNYGPASGPRKAGGFGKRPGGAGPGGAKRPGGGFGAKPGGFGKRPGGFGAKPGGFGKRPGGGKPRG